MGLEGVVEVEMEAVEGMDEEVGIIQVVAHGDSGLRHIAKGFGSRKLLEVQGLLVLPLVDIEGEGGFHRIAVDLGEHLGLGAKRAACARRAFPVEDLVAAVSDSGLRELFQKRLGHVGQLVGTGIDTVDGSVGEDKDLVSHSLLFPELGCSSLGEKEVSDKLGEGEDRFPQVGVDEHILLSVEEVDDA